MTRDRFGRRSVPGVTKMAVSAPQLSSAAPSIQGQGHSRNSGTRPVATRQLEPDDDFPKAHLLAGNSPPPSPSSIERVRARDAPRSGRDHPDPTHTLDVERALAPRDAASRDSLCPEDDAIGTVVLELSALCRTSTLAFATSVGELIIRRFYSGDLANWRTHNPRKAASLRKLAAHPDLPMTAASLYRSIAIYELTERLGVRSWKHVSATHLRMVLPLHPDEQVRLLSDAEASAWSVRRLEHEVQRSPGQRIEREDRGGRRRTSRLDAALQALERANRALEAVLQASDGFDVYSVDTRAAVDLLERGVNLCATAAGRMKRSLPGAVTIPPKHDDSLDEPDVVSA